MSQEDRDGARPLRTGDRLPSLSSSVAREDERASRRRPERYSRVVVFLPADEPDAGADYIGGLAEHHERFRLWDGRVIVVTPAGPEVARRLGEHVPFDVRADPDGAIHRRWGLDMERAALFVADRWGQIYHAEMHAAVRDLATPAEIDEWLKYLATQCAECGVPDEPGHGEWGAA